MDHFLRWSIVSLPWIYLLGALSAGDASKKAPTSQPFNDYIHRFMHYTDEQIKLLLYIFRHKIVRLAQTKAVSEFNGKKSLTLNLSPWGIGPRRSRSQARLDYIKKALQRTSHPK
jgi:hypothetical protein